ncbi:low molecular weight protein-tyrosine-phosphatase [Gallaecimonas sp. GXIMD4217]|uniref:low molecular weight protein-tyrosine-phosphatase n=1 Tax=Gallaecimonas sp. GXIMD4217 TaxID=3131927 RepID=UPI00311AFEC0
MVNPLEIRRILFCCMGNICRSPTAEAVFRKRMQLQGISLELESAGTIDYHAGEGPDRRARLAGERRGYDFSNILARQVCSEDFVRFDLILAMDRQNYADLMSRCPQRHRHKLRLFMSFAPETGFDEVPDPYYGGEGGFEQVLDLIEAASDGVLKSLLGK